MNGVVDNVMVNSFLWLRYRTNRTKAMWHNWSVGGRSEVRFACCSVSFCFGCFGGA